MEAEPSLEKGCILHQVQTHQTVLQIQEGDRRAGVEVQRKLLSTQKPTENRMKFVFKGDLGKD